MNPRWRRSLRRAARKTVLYDVMNDDAYFAPDEIALAPDEELDEAADEEDDEEDGEGEYEDEDEEYEDEEDGEYEEVAEDDADAEDDEEDGEAGQGALDLGPGYKRTDWKLPAASLLKRGTGKQVDERLIDAGGEVLEATLQEFGVDACLDWPRHRPHREPLRARARARREGQQGDEPRQGDRVRDGEPRRAYPRSDPGGAARSVWKCRTRCARSSRSATSSRVKRPTPRRTRCKWGSAATFPVGR